MWVQIKLLSAERPMLTGFFWQRSCCAEFLQGIRSTLLNSNIISGGIMENQKKQPKVRKAALARAAALGLMGAVAGVMYSEPAAASGGFKWEDYRNQQCPSGWMMQCIAPGSTCNVFSEPTCIYC
jgi:hypothetical protein